jgi:hypothetical protein
MTDTLRVLWREAGGALTEVSSFNGLHLPAMASATEECDMDKDEVIPFLKTCPFCNDMPQIVFSGTYRVQCPDCGANGPPFPSADGAAKRWNRRGSGSDPKDGFA